MFASLVSYSMQLKQKDALDGSKLLPRPKALKWERWSGSWYIYVLSVWNNATHPSPSPGINVSYFATSKVCFTSLCYRIMRRLLGVVYSGLLLQSELKQSSIRVVSPPVQHRLCRRSEGCNQCSVPFNDHLFKFNLSLIHLE